MTAESKAGASRRSGWLSEYKLGLVMVLVMVMAMVLAVVMVMTMVMTMMMVMVMDHWTR